MESCLILRIIGVSSYDGVSRSGKPYRLITLEVDYQGQKVKIKCFENDAKIGDYAQIAIGTRKTIYGIEFCVSVEKVIAASELENNFAR